MNGDRPGSGTEEVGKTQLPVSGGADSGCRREAPGSRYRTQGSGFRVQGSGFRVSGFRVQGSGFGVQGSGFRFQGPRFRVQGLEADSGCRREAARLLPTVTALEENNVLVNLEGQTLLNSTSTTLEVL